MLGLEQQGELILYNKFSSQLDKGFQGLSETMLSIQKHTDCSAAVVHQNQQGLDVLPVSPRRMLFLCQRIWDSKIQQVQSDIQNRREQSEASNSWIFENTLWKRTLPFITPFPLIFLVLLFLPGLINLVSTFLQRPIQNYQSNN